MELTLDQALKKGVEAHKAGKAQEADRYYTAILKANPKHPDASHNMGVLAVGVGKVEEALPFFKTALEANPSIAQYWLSYIDALIKLDRLAEARVVLEQAKSKGVKGDGFDGLEKQLGSFPSKKLNTQEPSQDELNPLIKLYNQNKSEQVFNEAQNLTKRYSKSLILWSLMGASATQIGKLDEAVFAFREAISIKPDYAESYNNMGNALQKQGKLEVALDAYRKALAIKPDLADAYNNMGVVLQEQGKLEAALEAYRKALAIKPDFAEAYNNMGNALEGVIFTKRNRDLQKTIFSLLEKKTAVRPTDIAKAAISLLKLEPTLQRHLELIDDVIQSPLDVISDLSKLPLLMKLMSVCPLPDLELEKLFKNLRRAVLSNVVDMKDASTELIKFQSALASQCFTNEYVYNHTDKEEKILHALEANLEKVFKNNEQPSPQIILTLASYKALNEYDWCNLLVKTDHIQEVVTRQVEEPNEEEKLKKQVPILEEITDPVSSKVRDQYEESPYPRWINLGLPLKQKSISKVAGEINLKLQDNKITEVKKPEILIAGCGTGQHSIGTAKRFRSSNVLAIDLSLSSLAYAKRKTEELAIKNLEYMQADILDLGQLNKQFDIIESAGVLHHMDDPMAGWKVLTDCLKLGGLMKIGLYSELARKPHVKIRNEICQQQIGSSDAEMRLFRDMMIKSNKDHHKLMRIRLDFYSLSTLRDLLFHVREHRFTIPQLKEHLDTLGLKFCGFQSNEIVSHFKQTNPHKGDPFDLDQWQPYEEANPRAFAGMYQFWCQKVA